MRTHLITLCCSVFAAAPVAAGDYSKIDRKIVREPAYTSDKPLYALLLFGRTPLRVWVSIDAEAVYLDRNANGDLTDVGERFEKAAELKDIKIADPDGKTSYVISSLSYDKGTQDAPPSLAVEVSIQGAVEYQQYCDAWLKDSPGAAAIAHFHGPLTAGPRTILWKVPPALALATGEKPVDLYATIGTMEAEHGCWVVVRSQKGNDNSTAFSEQVFPVVEVDFPPKKPDQPRIRRRYELKEVC